MSDQRPGPGRDDLVTGGLAVVAGALAFAAPGLVLTGGGEDAAEVILWLGFPASAPSFLGGFETSLRIMLRLYTTVFEQRPDLLGLAVGLLAAAACAVAPRKLSPSGARVVRVVGLVAVSLCLAWVLTVCVWTVDWVQRHADHLGRPPHPGRDAQVAEEVLVGVRRGLADAKEVATPEGRVVRTFRLDAPGAPREALLLPWGQPHATDVGRELRLTYPLATGVAPSLLSIDRDERPPSPFDADRMATRHRFGFFPPAPRFPAVFTATEIDGVRYGYTLTFSRHRAAASATSVEGPPFVDDLFRVTVHVFRGFDPTPPATPAEPVPDSNVPTLSVTTLVALGGRP